MSALAGKPILPHAVIGKQIRSLPSVLKVLSLILHGSQYMVLAGGEELISYLSFGEKHFFHNTILIRRDLS